MRRDELDAASPGTAAFSFPLNVYAHLLQRLEGRADYLHFAVYADGEGSAPGDVLRAQERASALLWQALPPPCRLLEVGIGLGTTLARLTDAGYDALGITPEPAQIEVAHARHGQRPRLECARLEDFNGDAGRWQALLFQESAQYIEPLALFEAADRLLADGPATLVVMDEFALRRSEASHTGLHHLDAFCALAARFGWRLSQRIDLSRAVQPTVDYLLRTTRAERAALMADLGLGADALDGLDAALTRHQTLYRQGVYGYALLKLERERRPEDRLVPVGGPQSQAMRRLFEQVFGHAQSADEWLWKYGEWRGRAVGLQRADALVAHYGAMTREVIFAGERVAAAQICDVMVDASARQSLGRNGPLHRITATFLDTEIGWGLRHRIGFGFPTERAFAVAEKLGLYAAVDQMVCAAWPATRAGHGLSCRALQACDLERAAAPAATVDRLWQAMAAALPTLTLGVRDAAWVRHRYLQHPRLRYDVLLVRRRWTRRPVGVVVLRRHDTHLEWVDAIGPPDHWPLLLAVARSHAAAQGLPKVEAWITQSQQHLLSALAAAECELRPLNITVPANVHSAGPSLESQRGRWLLMAGDTDFR